LADVFSLAHHTVLAAAFFMKMPIALPILASIDLLCSFLMRGSSFDFAKYWTEELTSNLVGLLLVLTAWIAYFFRPKLVSRPVAS
jgi:site-specific recombinase